MLRLLRRIYGPAIACLAVVGIVVMLGRQRESVELLRRVDAREWAMIASLMAINVLAFGLRVQLVLQRFLRARIETLWWLRVFVNAFALNSVMPQAGAVYRGVELKRRYDLEVLSYVRGYYFIAWFGVLFILVYGIVALLSIGEPASIGEWSVAQIAGLAVVAIAVAPFVLFSVLPRLVPAHSRFGVVRNALRDTLGFTAVCLRDPRFVATFAALSAFTFVVDVGNLALSIRALGFDAPLSVTVQMFALTSILGLVRITPGNIGVQEFAIGAVGLQAGLTLADGVVLSLLTRALRVLAVVALFALLNVVAFVTRRGTAEPQLGPPKQEPLRRTGQRG